MFGWIIPAVIRSRFSCTSDAGNEKKTDTDTHTCTHTHARARANDVHTSGEIPKSELISHFLFSSLLAYPLSPILFLSSTLLSTLTSLCDVSLHFSFPIHLNPLSDRSTSRRETNVYTLIWQTTIFSQFFQNARFSNRKLHDHKTSKNSPGHFLTWNRSFSQKYNTH